MTTIVLGGAGAMGRITVRDLLETADGEILIADYNIHAAEEYARSLRSKRVRAAFADVNRPKELVKVLKRGRVVINAVQYQWNLRVMEAALRAGVHYVDLGGLFHMTRRQLKLHRRFRKAGLTALIGVGAAPGITNLLAASVAERMDKVHEIECLVGGVDKTRYNGSRPLAVSYSLETILEEFTTKPAVFEKGRFRFVPPQSGISPHRFPRPVGLQRPMYTLHSEVATLPLTYRDKGIRKVTFRIAFEEELIRQIRILQRLGLTGAKPVSVKGERVVPRDLLVRLASLLPQPEPAGPIRQYEVIRSIVRGREKGREVVRTVDCHCRGKPDWGIGLDIDTGAPPSIAAQMILDGRIRERGVLPPETGIPWAPFFKELKRRGMKIVFSGSRND